MTARAADWFRAESTGERVTLFGRRVVRRAEFRELLRKTYDEKLSFGRIESEKIGRHLVRNT